MAQLNARSDNFIALLLHVSGRARTTDIQGVTPDEAAQLLRAYAQAHPEIPLSFEGETLVYAPGQPTPPAEPATPSVPEPIVIPEVVPEPPEASFEFGPPDLFSVPVPAAEPAAPEPVVVPEVIPEPVATVAPDAVPDIEPLPAPPLGTEPEEDSRKARAKAAKAAKAQAKEDKARAKEEARAQAEAKKAGAAEEKARAKEEKARAKADKADAKTRTSGSKAPKSEDSVTPAGAPAPAGLAPLEGVGDASEIQPERRSPVTLIVLLVFLALVILMVAASYFGLIHIPGLG